MKIYKLGMAFSLLLSVAVVNTAVANDLPHTFSAGNKAVASEVNANFAYLLQRIEELENRIEELERDSVPGLANYLEVYEADDMPADTGAKGPLVRFAGVNVQVVDGSGQTAPATEQSGLGNLLVGYDENREEGCSEVRYRKNADCVENNGDWGNYNHKTGSHNLIIGAEHNYTYNSTLVVGYQNTVAGELSSITGGEENLIRTSHGHIGGGYGNTASGPYSSVSGGVNNTASGINSHVGGGENNTASGINSHVGGGWNNTASGINSHVGGGRNNTASGLYSSIGGGENNTASGSRSHIGGGHNQEE